MQRQQYSKNHLILDRFTQQRKISQSQKYKTYLIKNQINAERYWIKIQKQKNQGERNVIHQAFFFQEMQGFKGIPFLIWSGNMEQMYTGLIIEKLGPSLTELMLKRPQKRFQLNEIALIGQHITTILQIIHDKNTLINTITFQTFRLGCGKSMSQLYIFDLFYCSKYQPNNTLVHKQQKPLIKAKTLTTFMSQNQLLKLSASRKDDMQLMLYFLIYLSRGTLPWLSSIQHVTEEKKVKMMLRFVESLKKGEYWVEQEEKCHQLKMISDHIYQLQFKERPNYNYIRNCFKKLTLKTNPIQTTSLTSLYSPHHQRYQLPHPSQLKLTTSKKDKQTLQKYYYPYEQQIKIDRLQLKYEAIWQNGQNENCHNVIKQNKDNKDDQTKVTNNQIVSNEIKNDDGRKGKGKKMLRAEKCLLI